MVVLKTPDDIIQGQRYNLALNAVIWYQTVNCFNGVFPNTCFGIQKYPNTCFGIQKFSFYSSTFHFQTISSLTVNSKTFFSDLIMNWIITFMLKLGLIIVEKGKEWTRGKFSDNGQGTKREVSCFSSFYNFLFTNHNCLIFN